MAQRDKPGREHKKSSRNNPEASLSSRNSDNFRLLPTEIQKPIINFHKQNDLVILLAPPGCGKDFIQMYRAMEGLISGEYQKVIFMRTIVEATDSKLGFLPGDENDKTKEYLTIFYDQMERMLDKSAFERLKKKVSFEYPGFIRGATIGGHDQGTVCVILTEAQNCTLKELVTISTRIAEGSKLFMSADPLQSDIGRKSGILDFVKIVGDIERVGVKYLGAEYQMRGWLVQQIDNKYREFVKNELKS